MGNIGKVGVGVGHFTSDYATLVGRVLNKTSATQYTRAEGVAHSDAATSE